MRQNAKKSHFEWKNDFYDHFLGSKNHNLECFHPQFCWLTKNNVNKCSFVMRENDQNMPVLLKITFRTPFSGPKNHVLEHNLIAFFCS